MNARNLLFLVLMVAGMWRCTQTAPPSTLTEKEKADGWVLLFDGETVNGGRDYQGTEVTGPWKVVDGLLEAQGAGGDASGYLTPDKQYENFELSWEWKISEGGNGGVLYHVLERPQYKVPYVTGPEYQIIDDAGYPGDLEDWRQAGADYAMYPADPSRKKLNPSGQWNTSKIVFDNGHVEHWLNGQKIVEFEAWSDDWFQRKNAGKWADVREYGLARKGHIVLQDHGAKAWYRNMKIKEPTRKPKKNEQLFNVKALVG